MALGCASALERDGGVFEIADCGAGKTSVAIGTVVAHARGRASYRVVVMCPGHIVGSWIQELDDVLGVKAVEISSWRSALSVSHSPSGVEWLIVGRDRAKLGPLQTRATWLVGDKELCPDCGAEAGGKDICLHCRAQMWQYTRPRRWPIAKILAKKKIDYFIGDEVHELGSRKSAQANAAGRFIARARYKILLTATPTGGKAEDIRPTLFRMFPHEMVRRGFAWEDQQKFSERYGRVEIDSRGKRKRKSVAPGIMPDLFADFMLPHAGFLRLEDISDNLPAYSEETMLIKMGSDLGRCYADLEAALKVELSDLLKKGKMQLLGPMLAALLCYPDAPAGWGNIGYLDYGVRVPVYKPESYVGMTQKDKAIIKLCKSEKKLGRQVWLYIQNKRVGRRLFSLLAAEGLNTRWLTTKEAKPRQRREWISQNAPGLDVMISHAKLVQTGIDLFDKKKWKFNFPTLVFAQCGMIPSELRQAAGRARRIGQIKPCRTIFMTYAGTVQQKLHQLMLRKLAAAEVLEGKILQSYDMQCEDSLTAELARVVCSS